MANNNETVGGLYLSLGLDVSELESGFIAVDRTVSQNMARLNRESNLIRLRAEVEIGNLDETADATQILTIRETALNRQMQIQRDRIRLTEASLQQLTQQHGASAAVTQRMAMQLERERLALQRLQSSLDELHENADDAGSSFENLTDILSNGKFAAVAAGITAIGGALQFAADASVELIERFRELQKTSYDLNMPFDKTKDFMRQLKLGGGEYGDFEGYIRGITDAYVKGEVDDPEFIALSRYGAQITDATGRLKDFKDITEEVYQAYERAKAEGNEIEFLQLTGGEAGVRDAKQFFDRYKEAKEDAAKIFDSGINPNELHQAERSLNLLTEQMGEFKDAATDLITPATKAVLDDLFEAFHSGTKFIAENKEEIQSWGFIAKEAFSTFGDNLIVSNLENAFNAISKATSQIKNVKLDFGNAEQNAQFEKFSQGIEEQNEGTLRNYFLDKVFGGIIERATENQIEYNNAVKGATASWADFKKEINEVDEKTSQLSQYGQQRINQFKDELKDLKIELKFGDDEYGKAKAQLDLWLERELNDKLRVSKEEEVAIRELYAAKAEQIEREHEEEILKIKEESQKKVQDLIRETSDIEFEITHDAFEKQMRDIELWKDAQLEKADTAEEVAATIENAAMKEAEAFEREMDRIKGKIESLQDKIFAQEHSRYDIDMRNAQKQYSEYAQEGIYPKEMIDRWYNNEMRSIQNRARQDSGGNYTKNPNGGTNLNNDYLIEFGKQVEDTTKNWIEMDASQLAYKKTLEKSIDNISEFDRGFQQASDDVNKWNNNIESAVQNAANKFDEFNPDTAVDNLNNTLNSISDHADNLNGAIDKNINALNNATSATATFNRAMKIVQNIEANKPQDFPLPQNNSTPKGNYELIYGANIAQLRNEKNYNPQSQIETFEGADLKFGADNFPQADIDNATNDVVNSLNQIPPPVTEVANSFSQLPPSVNDAVKSIMDQTTAAQENITANDTANKALNDALSNLATHSENVATALQSTADIILEVNDKLANFNVNTASQQDSSGGMSNMDVAKLSADIVSNIGEVVALAGAATGNPLVALGGGVVSFMGNVGSNIFDNLGGDSPFNNAGGTGNTDNYPNITEAIQSFQTEMSSLLGELSQTTSNISANVEQFTQKDTTPPNITVSPNINIDLGGAYVFDNAMKKQLTDDITTEVANAIKNAVQSAVNSNDYGYGT